jgi:hypothetical protein
VVKSKTDRRRMTRKLNDVRQRIRRLRHTPLSEQRTWISRALGGHDAYFGLPGNYRAIAGFHHEVQRAWCHALQRRGSKRRMTWARFHEILKQYPLPPPRITHTHASLLTSLKFTLGKSRVRESRTLGSVRAKLNG